MVVGNGHGWGLDPGRVRADADATVLPLYIDPMTKLFLVALMWCRPWLLDPAAPSRCRARRRSPAPRWR